MEHRLHISVSQHQSRPVQDPSMTNVPPPATLHETVGAARRGHSSSESFGLQFKPFHRVYLGEAPAVLSHDVWVRALQFPDDLKALIELGEDVDHGAGEQSVLRCLLELPRVDEEEDGAALHHYQIHVL